MSNEPKDSIDRLNQNLTDAIAKMQQASDDLVDYVFSKREAKDGGE